MGSSFFLFWFLFLEEILMAYLTNKDLDRVITIINNLNEYVINDKDIKNIDKLNNLNDLIKFRLKLENLYEDNDFGNVE